MHWRHDRSDFCPEAVLLTACILLRNKAASKQRLWLQMTFTESVLNMHGLFKVQNTLLGHHLHNGEVFSELVFAVITWRGIDDCYHEHRLKFRLYLLLHFFETLKCFPNPASWWALSERCLGTLEWSLTQFSIQPKQQISLINYSEWQWPRQTGKTQGLFLHWLQWAPQLLLLHPPPNPDCLQHGKHSSRKQDAWPFGALSPLVPFT